MGCKPASTSSKCGAAEGRAPHPLFDIQFYWQRRPDVRAQGANALLHYLQRAFEEDLDPHLLFDTSFYLEQADGLRTYGINPLVHFLQNRNREGLRPIPWFDPQWYLSCYPDVASVGNRSCTTWNTGGERDETPHHRSRTPRTFGSIRTSKRLKSIRCVISWSSAWRKAAYQRTCRHLTLRGRHSESWHQGPVLRRRPCCVSVMCRPGPCAGQCRLARLLDHCKGAVSYRPELAPLPSEPMAPTVSTSRRDV